LNFCYKGQQRHVTGAFDCDGQLPLMLGAYACLATRADLATVADKAAQEVGVFVVNR